MADKASTSSLLEAIRNKLNKIDNKKDSNNSKQKAQDFSFGGVFGDDNKIDVVDKNNLQKISEIINPFDEYVDNKETANLNNSANIVNEQKIEIENVDNLKPNIDLTEEIQWENPPKIKNEIKNEIKQEIKQENQFIETHQDEPDEDELDIDDVSDDKTFATKNSSAQNFSIESKIKEIAKEVDESLSFEDFENDIEDDYNFPIVNNEVPILEESSLTNSHDDNSYLKNFNNTSKSIKSNIEEQNIFVNSSHSTSEHETFSNSLFSNPVANSSKADIPEEIVLQNNNIIQEKVAPESVKDYSFGASNSIPKNSTPKDDIKDTANLDPVDIELMNLEKEYEASKLNQRDTKLDDISEDDLKKYLDSEFKDDVLKIDENVANKASGDDEAIINDENKSNYFNYFTNNFTPAMNYLKSQMNQDGEVKNTKSSNGEVKTDFSAPNFSQNNPINYPNSFVENGKSGDFDFKIQNNQSNNLPQSPLNNSYQTSDNIQHSNSPEPISNYSFPNINSNIVKEEVIYQATNSLKKLEDAKKLMNQVNSFVGDENLVKIAMNLMEPKLEKWLNNNLARIVEDAVRREIERISRK